MSFQQSILSSVRHLHLLSQSPRRLVGALTVLVGLMWVLQLPAQAQTGWQWYKADLHIHSVLSADAYPDLGILSKKAKDTGYNALFLTDHNLASSFPISNLTANHTVFEDSYTRWTSGTYGSLSPSTNVLASSPVKSGSKSLHLQSSSSGTGETFIWTERGPNFRSGDIILKVSIYPTRIDPGSGVYVSASIGGDSRVQSPVGYTTASGIISPGKSTLLVWQLGTARTPSSDPNARVLTYSLGPYTLNTWNNYTINVSQALADIPAADLPLDYNAVTLLKMATAANGGTADAYFDSYSIDASAPKTAGEEFIYRNSVIHTYDTNTFKIFPSVEMGVRKHAQRFNFGITDLSQFVSYYDGVDGILPTQQTGYPGQLNHPGSSGGVTAQEALDNHGYGADQVETNNQTHIDIWDGLLNQGSQILGVGSTDKHTASYTSSSGSTSIYAPSLEFDTLIHSIFEGRTFVNGGSFTGSTAFNLDSASQEPYPARFPVYVPATQTTANVHLAIPAGVTKGYKINWISNGVVIATDTVGGTSYDATKSISLSGSWTYVRAEVRSSSDSIRALTQPIFFVDVSGLPADKSYHVDGVTNADARGYTKIFTKGITASNWNGTSQALSLTLINPADALVRLLLSTATIPQQIAADGAVIPVADSLTTFESATSSIWYYDSANARLYLKVHHASTTANVLVNFSGQPPSNTPTSTSTPTNTPVQTNTPTSTSTPTNTPVQTNTPTSTSTPTITPVQTNTPTSTSTPTNTPISNGVLIFTPSADAYIRADLPDNKFGGAALLLVDNSPVKHSLLKFAITGVGVRTVASAKLRLYCQDSSSKGGDFYRVANTSWDEQTITWNNAPAADANLIRSLGAVSTGNWYEVDVTPLVSGDGTVSLRITSTSSDGADYSSKEGAAGLAPQLVVTLN